MLLTNLPAGEEETHEAIDGPSIFLVTEGSGKISWGGGGESGQHSEEAELGEGLVFFVGAGTEVKFSSEKEAALVLYRAFVEAP